MTVITDPDTDEKMLCMGLGFMPVAAVVDPELTLSLQRYAPGGGAGGDAMVLAMREIIDELVRSNAAVEVRPFKFVSTFREAYPLFAQRTDV